MWTYDPLTYLKMKGKTNSLQTNIYKNNIFQVIINEILYLLQPFSKSSKSVKAQYSLAKMY